MSDNKNAKRCGAEQFLDTLSHGRMISEARDYVQHILRNPTLAGYSQGDDVLGEIEGVEECLAYIRRAWKNVDTAEGLLLQLRTQLPIDGDTEPCEELLDEEPKDEEPLDDTPVETAPSGEKNPSDSVPRVKTEEDRGRPDSFMPGKSKSKGNGKSRRTR